MSPITEPLLHPSFPHQRSKCSYTSQGLYPISQLFSWMAFSQAHPAPDISLDDAIASPLAVRNLSYGAPLGLACVLSQELNNRTNDAKRARRIKNSVAPFNRYLPDELVSSIFRECDSILVSSICSLWREIAIDTATLWTTIRYQWEPTTATSMEKVDAFLTRSKLAPISLEILVNGVPSRSQMQDLAHLIKPHLHRVRRLLLTFSDVRTARVFLPLPSSMPILHGLSIMLGEDLGDLSLTERVPEQSFNLFESNYAACTPRSIHLFAPQHFAIQLPDFDDLSRMSTLSLAVRMPPAQMLDLVARASKLRSLDLMAHQTEAMDDQSMPVSYPLLERQRISGDGWTSLVSAPTLRSLTLVDHAALHAVNRAMSFYPRKTQLFPKLRALTIMTPEPDDVNNGTYFRSLARFIAEHSELKTLDFMACWSPIPTILELSLSRSPATNVLPCPNLEWLRLSLLYPIEPIPLMHVVRSLLEDREQLHIEFATPQNYTMPDALATLMRGYASRIHFVARPSPVQVLEA
ncbi:hypothetical protein BS47DRAFT_1386944 [Hydnum rufescens UP504]|uniref:F-box domain-containing protein n=1 Tax=Hydnum rufescens UP504 TaxID=1448309 RepID=A0A9P6BAI6_9AGAM|nr:hypothetical protein BS47DRAFT_1386944 [Hydnum rufescens UP504]